MDKQEIQKYIDTNTYDFSNLRIPSERDELVDQETLTNALFSIKHMDEIYENFFIHGSLLRSVLRRVEAKSSSTIENIHTTNIQMFDLKLLKKERPEVYGHVEMLKMVEDKVSLTWDKNFLCTLQKKIILNPEKQGIRKRNVVIASLPHGLVSLQKEHIKYIPTHHQQLENNLEVLFKFIENAGINVLVRAFCAHAIFELIHPFLDGNGRVGRILIPSIIRDGKNIRNMIYVSRYLEKNREKYYLLLQKIADTNGSLEVWSEWLHFCLKGILESQKELEKTCDAIDKLHKETREKINANSKFKNIDEIVGFLFGEVIFGFKRFMESLNLSKTTAQNRLKRLVELGILEHDRHGTYVFQRLLNVIFE